MKDLLDLLRTLESEDHVELYDHFDFEFDEDLLIESNVVGMTEDGIIINGDDVLIGLLEGKGFVCSPADNSGIKCSPSDDDINSIAAESLEAYETKSVSSTGISKQSYEQLATLLAKAMPDSKNANNLAREILGLDQNEIDESGLQAYLGNKKYGEKGMTALQKAGREGAGKEEMAKLRDKYDKLDEVEINEAKRPFTKSTIDPALAPITKSTIDPALAPITKSTIDPALAPITMRNVDPALAPITKSTKVLGHIKLINDRYVGSIGGKKFNVVPTLRFLTAHHIRQQSPEVGDLAATLARHLRHYYHNVDVDEKYIIKSANPPRSVDEVEQVDEGADKVRVGDVKNAIVSSGAKHHSSEKQIGAYVLWFRGSSVDDAKKSVEKVPGYKPGSVSVEKNPEGLIVARIHTDNLSRAGLDRGLPNRGDAAGGRGRIREQVDEAAIHISAEDTLGNTFHIYRRADGSVISSNQNRRVTSPSNYAFNHRGGYAEKSDAVVGIIKKARDSAHAAELLNSSKLGHTNWKPHVNDEVEQVDEAKYQGREVPLGKKMQGDVKKSKVYVRKPNGKVVKVNFGDKNMRIKKSNPGRRKNFRARHNCKNPGPRWKARYWSCRSW